MSNSRSMVYNCIRPLPLGYNSLPLTHTGEDWGKKLPGAINLTSRQGFSFIGQKRCLVIINNMSETFTDMPNY